MASCTFNKRLRLKHEYCNKLSHYRPILMKLVMQPSYGTPFLLTKFQKGQRPEGHKVKGQNFKKLAEAILAAV